MITASNERHRQPSGFLLPEEENVRIWQVVPTVPPERRYLDFGPGGDFRVYGSRKRSRAEMEEATAVEKRRVRRRTKKAQRQNMNIRNKISRPEVSQLQRKITLEAMKRLEQLDAVCKQDTEDDVESSQSTIDDPAELSRNSKSSLDIEEYRESSPELSEREVVEQLSAVLKAPPASSLDPLPRFPGILHSQPRLAVWHPAPVAEMRFFSPNHQAIEDMLSRIPSQTEKSGLGYEEGVQEYVELDNSTDEAPQATNYAAFNTESESSCSPPAPFFLGSPSIESTPNRESESCCSPPASFFLSSHSGDSTKSLD